MKNRHRRCHGFCLLSILACAIAEGGTMSASPSAEFPLPVEVTGGWLLLDAAKVPVQGDALSQASYQAPGWYAAVVPGTVLTSLVKDGVYPEPLYGENNRPDKIPDSLCRASYWYRTAIDVPATFSGKQIWLNFEGINYLAEVWVNGKKVGNIRGAFARGTFNVTGNVETGHKAFVAVHVFPQPNPGYTHEKTVYSGTGGNGGNSALDGPTFLCAIGWDWIPGIRDRDTGIWQKVTLSATGPVVIQDPFVVSDLPLPRTDTLFRDHVAQRDAHHPNRILGGTIRSDLISRPREPSAPRGSSAQAQSGHDSRTAPLESRSLVAQRLRAAVAHPSAPVF
jgi:hypothetical protein